MAKDKLHSPEEATAQPVSKSTIVSNGLRSRRMIGLAIFVLVLLAAAGGAYYSYKNAWGPALVIGDARISRKQYKELIDQAAKQKVAKSDAVKTIIDVEKKKQVAKDLKLTVRETDVLQVAGAKYGLYDPTKMDSWQRLVSTEVAIKNAVLTTKRGGYQGVYLAFPYSKKFVQALINQPAFDGFGDRTAVEADKKYALDKANEYREKLQRKSITNEAAVKAVVSDQRLDFGGAGNDSTEFLMSDSGLSYSQGDSTNRQFDPYIVDVLKRLKAGEVSEVGTIKLDVPMSPLPEYKGADIPVGYFVVKLDSINQPKANFDQTFNKAVGKVKVVKNV